MMKQFLYGAAALAIVGGVAYAENNVVISPPAPAEAQMVDNAGTSPPDDGQGWWGRKGHRHDRWPMHGGMAGREMMAGPDGRGPMGGTDMPNHHGFRLELGNGIGVRVACGNTEMKDCIANAQALIDAAKAAAAAQPQAKAQ